MGIFLREEHWSLWSSESVIAWRNILQIASSQINQFLSTIYSRQFNYEHLRILMKKCLVIWKLGVEILDTFWLFLKVFCIQDHTFVCRIIVIIVYNTWKCVFFFFFTPLAANGLLGMCASYFTYRSSYCFEFYVRYYSNWLLCLKWLALSSTQRSVSLPSFEPECHCTIKGTNVHHLACSSLCG